MTLKKEQFIKNTPCIAIFMDFCSSPFWEFHKKEGFSSCNLWEEDLYELIPADLKQRFIDYQNEWENRADENLQTNSDNSFEVDLNSKVKSLAEDLKKSIPELQIFYAIHTTNENQHITHSFEEVVFNTIPDKHSQKKVLTDINKETCLWKDLYCLCKSDPKVK